MRRKLTEEAKRMIRRSFYERIVRGIGDEALVRIMAAHACALLELGDEDTEGWWETMETD